MTVKWRAQSKDEMLRARQALLAAETLLEKGLLEDAVSRAYYAVLHAAKAALATEEEAPKTHSGVLRILGERLVKTGRIEIEYSRIFSAGQDDREFCDYVSSFRIGQDKAELRVHDAAKFIDRIKRYLKDQKTAQDGVPGHSPDTTVDVAAMKVREGPPGAYVAKRARPGAKGRAGRR